MVPSPSSSRPCGRDAELVAPVLAKSLTTLLRRYRRVWCRYDLDEEGIQFGYRLIWRRPDGDLQAARGQARIPSIASARGLMDRAVAEGWGDRDGDAMLSAAENLRARGYVVELGAGYVGYRNRQASDTDARRPKRWSGAV
jgi:hypothetical protein